ncbi:protein of unknown function [Hyphomicrobium sp. MC1]|nr:protein of unknown function [Hyphomicrobium sp. MC1]
MMHWREASPEATRFVSFFAAVESDLGKATV